MFFTSIAIYQVTNNYVAPVWFIYKQLSLFILKVLKGGVKCIRIVSGFEIEVEVVQKNIYPVILVLNKHSLLQYKILIDIICYDLNKIEQRYFIIYNLVSLWQNTRIRVITKSSNLGTLLSLVGIYRSIIWYEREVFDFFGIFFYKNKDLRRILTDYGFRGFPLRKDFPVTGFIDVYYDDSQKRICYNSLELVQEYRNFKFKSEWRFF